jgi:hypothetical protein
MDALRPLREGPKLSTLTNLPQVARDPPSTCGRGVKDLFLSVSIFDDDLNQAINLSAVGTTAAVFNQFSSGGVPNLGGLQGAVTSGAGLNCSSGTIFAFAI